MLSSRIIPGKAGGPFVTGNQNQVNHMQENYPLYYPLAHNLLVLTAFSKKNYFVNCQITMFLIIQTL